jgi:hypothetical protein
MSMVPLTDDDSGEDETLLVGALSLKHRPHIQPALAKLSREIQRILMLEPRWQLNLCKIPEKYLASYGREIGKY